MLQIKFVSLVVELATKTAEYVKATLYKDIEPIDNIDPNLSIRHIAGLADYITEDTILDVKVRNNIDEKCIRQVLAYHYLSTKRSDLNIKRVIVYDATSGRDVVINISEKNLTINYNLLNENIDINENDDLLTFNQNNNEINVFDEQNTLMNHDTNEGQESFEKQQSYGRNAVICIETGEVYDNAKLAAKAIQWTGLPMIEQCCKDSTKTAGGFHWMRYNDYINLSNKSNVE